ncbi:hypothetical protein I7I48_07033 [Histoplasma ohiense]|nr:hypothetical protein I7I48_07033 [Histoplasma ohiense (nom. inval.)]
MVVPCSSRSYEKPSTVRCDMTKRQHCNLYNIADWVFLRKIKRGRKKKKRKKQNKRISKHIKFSMIHQAAFRTMLKQRHFP